MQYKKNKYIDFVNKKREDFLTVVFNSQNFQINYYVTYFHLLLQMNVKN